MKGKIIKITTWLISKLQKFYFKLTYKEVGEVGYSSLSPIDNYSIEDSETQTIEVIDHNQVINNDDYLKALLWALKNRRKENIKNIALTGSYGSGKSSILRTFQKHYKSKDLEFLEISLATFKEEKPTVDEDGNIVEPDKDQLLRLIETSILEQIFYHEEDDKVPDSRFKKIKSYSKKQLFANTACLLLFIIAILNYLFPYLIQSIFKDYPFSGNICNWLHYGGLIIIVLGIFLVVYKSIRLINSITLNKLNIQNAEIGFGDNNSNKSILNHHIDEILYFFSVRPYNVVIIEDLDRFRKTEIFTKLREVNLLLNSSERTKRKDIVFIYAVRDEMFTDKERAKFFDFIIPIIPIINSSNSGEILRSKKEKYNYEISDRFIEDISFYIDDMRLLNNICNEFYLYKQKLNKNLNQDKLFAIITYKNIYPNDFVKLSCNEGDLYKIIYSKKTYIKKIIEEIDAQISLLQAEVALLDGSTIKDIRIIRKVYILKLIEHIDMFYMFSVNDNEVSIENLTEDENFEYFIRNKLFYLKWRWRNYSNDYYKESIGVTFSDIETKVDPNKKYAQKEKEIEDFHQGKITSFKSKIQELEKLKSKTRNFKLIELLKSNFKLEIETDINKNFIHTLLKNGYISEDYIDYISLFHEGSITRTDHQYIINLRNEIKIEPDYTLNKLDKIIEKLNPLDFETEYILNYNLVDYLLSTPSSYANQLQAVFNKLKDESKASIEFINGFIETSDSLEVFVKTLCKYWTNIWAYIINDSFYTDESELKYFKLILEYADIPSIKKIAEQSDLEQIILAKTDFLTIIQDENKLVQIIQELGLFFTDIDFPNSPDSLLEFIYENNFYQIDTSIIIPIIKKFGKFDQVAFDNSNYTAILKSECPYLIKCIESNIQLYIEVLYLYIETNVNEEEESYIKLLNNKEIDLETKNLLIQRIKTKITTLDNVKDSTFYPTLFSENKVVPKWENLLSYYNIEDEITDQMIIFLNNIDNARELSQTKIPLQMNDSKVFVYSKICRDIIICENIVDENFDYILNAYPFRYHSIDISALSMQKITSLINHKKIMPTANGFKLIKEYSNDLIIGLVETQKSEILKIVNEIEWDSNDLNLILKSNRITNSEKKSFLDNCTDIIVADNKENLMLINQIMLDDLNFIVNDNLIKMIILESRNPIVSRIQLFNKYPSLITSLDDFIDTLSGNYLEISNNSKRAVLNDTQYNRRFLDILTNRNYIASYSDKKGDLRVYHSTK